MRAIQCTVLFLLSVLLVNCSEPQEKINYFSNNAFGNPVGGKAGEYYKGVTYITCQGEKENLDI